MYLSIPDGGGLFTLTRGAVEINFFEGKIMMPDGTVVSMRTSLKTQEVDEMRSLVFVTSGQVGLSIDGGGYFTLDAGEKLMMADYGFQSLYLDVPDTIYIKLMASTTPEMTVAYDRFFSQDLSAMFSPLEDSLYDADERTAQIVELDLTSYGRAQVEAFATASTATEFTLEASDDNSHWFTVSTMKTNDYHEGFFNAARYVRLRSAVGGIQGDKVSLVLIASR